MSCELHTQNKKYICEEDTTGEHTFKYRVATFPSKVQFHDNFAFSSFKFLKSELDINTRSGEQDRQASLNMTGPEKKKLGKLFD